MNGDERQQIREIVDDALRRKPDERSEFVSSACAGDEGLREKVQSLLSELAAAEGSLETPTSAEASHTTEQETLRLERGKCFGHYEIVEQIGAGGMGEVYLARDKKLERKVAVKILNEKFSRDESNLRRFVAEAKAASALNHPNILVIHEVGTEDQAHYIVSEFVKGPTLRQLLNESPLKPEDIVDYAVQMASALSSAHEARLIHRDVKPENIIIRPDGFIKVLDFGLAKLIGDQNKSILGLEESTVAANATAKGVIMGTVNYMSPEQAKGETVDERTDIFSLGVVLYEMISGKRPFAGDSMAQAFANLINNEPEPLAADVPAVLRSIVAKTLRKDREDRYQTMREFLADLKELRDAGNPNSGYKRWAASNSDNQTAILPQTNISHANATADNSSIYTVWHKRWRIEVGIVLLLALCAGGYWAWQRTHRVWVGSQVARAEELAKAGKYFEAFDLASEVEEGSPGEPGLMALMPTISDTLTVNSEPAGAHIYLKRYQPDDAGTFPERQLLGTTPINGVRIPKGPQIVYLEKDGYAPIQTVINNRIIKFGDNILFNPSTSLEISRNLMEANRVPENMTFVPGGEYRLASSQRPTDDKVKLDDYFIDKYEVSNKDFKEFINAGGYTRQEYWKVPFAKDGHPLSWEEAMLLFRDRTSLQGPRDWSNETFPDGKADNPVTGITWYEAAAYAEFKGKKLPTVFQWEKAARNGAHQDASYKMPWGDHYPGDSFANRANFENTGTVPVDSEEFGISEFGAFNMAGNVSEWVLNTGSDGFYATGGAWGEPPYTFSYFGQYPGLFESPKRGFRCVSLVAADRASGDQGGTSLRTGQSIPTYVPTTDVQFREIARSYDYAATPLDAEVVEVIETADWRREKITFNGAGGKRAIAYLYLPHNAARPLQVVHMIGGSDVENGITAVPVSAEGWLGAVVKSGRALLAVVTEGNSERPWPADFKKPPYDSVEWQELVVNRFTDHRRALDYLASRGDIDMGRLVYTGFSAGASQGLILPAIENRYRSVFLISAGLPSFFMTNQPAANPINFAPHVLQPKYVLNGRYDETFPVRSAVEPMMKLFADPKELELYDGPHSPPIEVLVPSMNKFLDRTLGPVRRQ